MKLIRLWLKPLFYPLGSGGATPKLFFCSSVNYSILLIACIMACWVWWSCCFCMNVMRYWVIIRRSTRNSFSACSFLACSRS